jgi:Tfp pilus assembly protein PilO
MKKEWLFVLKEKSLINKFFLQRVSPAQVNIVIVTLTIVFTFYITAIHMYIPGQKEAIRLNKQIALMDSQIVKIKKSIPKGHTTFSEKNILKKHFYEITNSFPKSEETAIAKLQAIAKKSNLTHFSIKKTDYIKVLNDSGNPILIDGKTCQQLPVRINANGNYSDIVNFLTEIRELFSVYTSVDSIKINKNDDKTLNALITLNIYLLNNYE